jgi:hypothetical protein
MQRELESELTSLINSKNNDKYGSNDKFASNDKYSSINRRQSNEMLYDNRDESYYNKVRTIILKGFRFDYRSKKQWILILSVIMLMLATAVERVTFKMSVDKMTPFRLVLVLFIFAISTVIYGSVTLFKLIFTVFFKI